ncbi:MAG: hypothetical protein QF410_02145 [Planctomycetota bacterium]|jgi:hypothetical protein|nr:hypothetical protein [Planctomycetota bacterium]
MERTRKFAALALVLLGLLVWVLLVFIPSGGPMGSGPGAWNAQFVGNIALTMAGVWVLCAAAWRTLWNEPVGDASSPGRPCSTPSPGRDGCAPPAARLGRLARMIHEDVHETQQLGSWRCLAGSGDAGDPERVVEEARFS